MPAKAGIQFYSWLEKKNWIPASAGMTEEYGSSFSP
jgi:hypothetical protein